MVSQFLNQNIKSLMPLTDTERKHKNPHRCAKHLQITFTTSSLRKNNLDNKFLRERIMSNIINLVLVKELLIYYPWGIRNNLINPPARGHMLYRLIITLNQQWEGVSQTSIQSITRPSPYTVAMPAHNMRVR